MGSIPIPGLKAMCDGNGRHVGLKILCLEINVRVQVPPQLKKALVMKLVNMLYLECKF
jgi:hypothetical protein